MRASTYFQRHRNLCICAVGSLMRVWISRGNGRRRFVQAFLLRSFGIRHFSREANAAEHRRGLHIYGVVEWQTTVLQLKGFPTIEEVENADKEQLARWYRFLPSGETASDQEIMKRIAERFDKLGGMTAELSKSIGM